MQKNNLLTDISYFVFFDVDETVINTKSMFSFLKFYFIKQYPSFKIMGYLKYLIHYYKLKFFSKIGKKREWINLQYYKLYKNKQEKIINHYGKQWFMENIRNENFFNEKVIKEMQYHKQEGARIVLVSGSFDACLRPIADYLGADKVLATKLEVSNGKYTGNILFETVIGEGKKNIIKSFLRKINYNDYGKCFAYGDHISDLPMLKLVGNPVVVVNCEKLKKHAKFFKWRILC